MTETARLTSRRTLAALTLAVAVTVSSACDFNVGGTAAGSTQPAAQPTKAGDASRQRNAKAPTENINATEFQKDMSTAVSITTDFWRRHWTREFTGSYTSPRVLGSYDGNDPATIPKCGREPLEKNNAAYCPAGDFIAWDINLMRSGYARGDAWVYLVISHEWGHSIQNRLRRGLVSAAAELQADCLAGAVLYGSADDGTLKFEPGDEQELVDAFQVIGDRSPWTKPGDHGSATQRLRSFSRGGTGGVKACFK